MEDGSFYFKDLIQSGFSVAVAAFLLIRLEKEIKKLADAINRLRHCKVCKFNDDNLSN
jgi:hypothetical protein